MSEGMLIIGSVPGLFPPIKVKVGETEYVVNVTHPSLKKILELESGVVKGSLEALAAMYDEAEMMTGAPREVLNAIDVREIRELIVYVANQIFHPEKEIPAKEKNGLGPGESK